MDIRKKLSLLYAMMLVAGIVVMIFAVVIKISFTDTLETESLTDELYKGIAELVILSKAYTPDRHDRVQQQWHTRMASIRKILREAATQLPEQKTAFDVLSRRLKVIDKRFKRIIESTIDYAGINKQDKLLQAINEDLNVEARLLLDDARRLDTLTYETILRHHNIASTLIILIVLAGIVIIFALSSWIKKRIVKPLTRMEKETRKIAGGDFSHRLNFDSDDEIGRLAKSFDYMTNNLRETMISRDYMESMVEERTEELQQAMQNAITANNAKSEFLSRVSHELRTPMNAILGFAQILNMDRTLNEQEQDNVEEIINAGNHLMALIDEVLDISKVDAGKMDIHIKPVALQSVVNEGIKLVEPMIAKRHISLEVQVDDAFVLADKKRLRQVLVNLLSNAVKYNRVDGSILVTTDSINNGVRVSVTDTGIGIPADKYASVFEPFSRISNSTEYTEGTGIGLAISKKLVEMMGGIIGFDSIVDKGTTFWVQLRSADSNADQSI